MERSWASSGKRASNSASSARRMSSTVEARTRSWSPRSRAGGFRRFCCIRGQRARSRGISMKKMSFVFPVAAALLFAGTLAGQSTVPEIPYDSAPNPLKLPEHVYLGEAAGVATNSKGNLFVYTRSGGTLASVGASRTFTHAGARLFEFAANGKFVREIGTGVYGFLFAQTVRVDPQDNIWVVDRGSNMVIKYSPDGRVALTLSRKPESVVLSGAGPGAGRGGGAGAGREGGAAPAAGRGAGGGGGR